MISDQHERRDPHPVPELIGVASADEHEPAEPGGQGLKQAKRLGIRAGLVGISDDRRQRPVEVDTEHDAVERSAAEAGG